MLFPDIKPGMLFEDVFKIIARDHSISKEREKVLREVIEKMKASLENIKEHDACINCLEFGYIKQGEHETDSPHFISKTTLAEVSKMMEGL